MLSLVHQLKWQDENESFYNRAKAKCDEATRWLNSNSFRHKDWYMKSRTKVEMEYILMCMDRERDKAYLLDLEEHYRLKDEALRESICDSLTGVYVCNRVWSAWQVGTMSEEDFIRGDECDELIDGILQLIKDNKGE